MTHRWTEWQRLEAAGKVRYTQGQYKCQACDRWHTVKMPRYSHVAERNLTLADRILDAARTARMRGCQRKKKRDDAH